MPKLSKTLELEFMPDPEVYKIFAHAMACEEVCEKASKAIEKRTKENIRELADIPPEDLRHIVAMSFERGIPALETLKSYRAYMASKADEAVASGNAAQDYEIID